MKDKDLAKLFHSIYEELAPNYGYETREETKQFNEDSANGKLMIEVCGRILRLIANDRLLDKNMLDAVVMPKIADTMRETFNIRHKAFKDVEYLKAHIDELEVYIEDLTVLANNIRIKYF